MATITLKVGSATSGRDYATIAAAWAAIPVNVVGSGNAYVLELYNDSEFNLGTTTLALNGKTTDPSHSITIRPAAGQGYTSNANVQTNAFRYNQANGVALRSAVDYADAINIDCDYVTLYGLQIKHTSGGNSGSGIGVPDTRLTVVIDSCIVDMAPDGNYVFGFTNHGITRNSLVFLRGAAATGIDASHSTASIVENCTVARASDRAANGTGIAVSSTAGATSIVRNCAVFGCTTPFSGINGSHNATDQASIAFGTGNLTGLNYTAQFVGTTLAAPDFRTVSGSALINAGTAPSSDNSLAPDGARQMGTSADIGAWEYPDPLQSPTATVGAISVTGQNVTISGTTTGSPTSGSMTLTPSAIGYNNGVAQGPTSLSLGTGTFTVTFTALAVGQYDIGFTVANSTYTASGTNNRGPVNVTGALAISVVQDPMDGQVLTIHGTTSGNPTSGLLTVIPAASNPNGALGQTVAITLGTGTFTVSATLAPGNYDPPILQFTNAAGTSLPQSGTSAVTILGISGNPAADSSTGGTPSVTVSGVTVSPASANLAGGAQQVFSATVSGTNSPAQSVTWSTTAGSINSSGVFTAPAATSSAQSITITATSTLDPSKSGQAVVTVAATSPVTPPSPPDPSGLPGAPLGIAALAGRGSATIVITPPASSGSSPIVSYLVTASTGQVMSSSSATLTFSLPALIPVSFTAQAVNGTGAGPASAPSLTVTPLPTASASPRDYSRARAPRKRTLFL